MSPDQAQQFLTSLWEKTDGADADSALQSARVRATAEGCVVHVLGLPSGNAAHVAALQAAGARAIAASLPLGGTSLLLIGAGNLDTPESFARHLADALQGYERINALVAPLNRALPATLISPEGPSGGVQPLQGALFWAILINAPQQPNAYWQAKA